VHHCAHLALALLVSGLLPTAPERAPAFETVVPALAYGGSCASTIFLQNLGRRAVEVELEGHRSSGALVPIEGHSGMTVRLAAGEIGQYKLHITGEDTDAWVKIRELVPAASAAQQGRGSPPVQRTAQAPSPVVAVSGTTECLVKNELHEASREVAYPLRNPWFSGEVAGLQGHVILLINTTAETATASACYSSGASYSVPASAEFQPLCSISTQVQIPPFGSRRFPIEAAEQSQFLLRTSGTGIVLQMLEPSREGARVYTVDSTIKFGGEVSGTGGK
jgi:hypothetical protein